MKRFLLLLVNEFRLVRTAVPIHLVAILQPTVMYLLMAAILVHPTFDMNIVQPTSEAEQSLAAAMQAVGSPIGAAYIRPVVVDEVAGGGMRQVVIVENRDGMVTAVQKYGLIDSNMVKNYRNRLTAAALILWNNDLGDRAVTIEERPWLARDVPFAVYFGMALLPMTVSLAAAVIGGILTAQDFESGTILEYRQSPTPPMMILGARLTRLMLSGLLAAGILALVIGLRVGVWPRSFWRVGAILLPVGMIAGSLGIIAGLILQKSIPSFLVGLVVSFVSWIMGSAFGLAAGFGGGYEFISRLTPNTHAVELLFPAYFGIAIDRPAVSVLLLILMSAGMAGLAAQVYSWRLARTL